MVYQACYIYINKLKSVCTKYKAYNIRHKHLWKIEYFNKTIKVRNIK
jgi:hypothetical protein